MEILYRRGLHLDNSNRTTKLFSPGTPASSTNKTDSLDITEILLKVAFKHYTPTKLGRQNIMSTMVLQLLNFILA